MNWDKFKAKISSEIDGYASEVNTTEIWHGIEPVVTADNRAYHDKKRRRSLFFLFLFFATMSVLGAGLFGLMNQKQDLLAEKTSETFIQLGHAQVESLSDPNIIAHTKLSDDVGIKINNDGVAEEGNKLVSDQKFTKQISTQNPKLKHGQAQINTINTLIDKKINNQESVEIKSEKEQTIIRNNIKDGEGEDVETVLIKTPSETPTRMDVIMPVIRLDYTLVSSDQAQPLTPSMVNQEKIPIAVVSKKLFNSRLDILGGMSSVSRSLTGTVPENTYWAEVRDMTETPLSSIHYGAHYTLQHKSNFALTIGYNHSTIYERFIYDEMSVDTSYEQGIQAAYVDIEEDTVALLGPVPTFITTTTEHSVVNRIQLREIPILLGYFKRVRGWSYGIQSGIYLNTSLVATGKIIESEGEVMILEDQPSEIYRSDVGLSYYAGLSISKEVIGNVSIGVSGFMRYYPENFSATSTGLKQSYRLLGGQMSIGYSF